MRVQNIDLETLTRDTRLRFRDPNNVAGKAEEYAEAMKEAEGWGDFPPLLCMELTEPFEWRQEAFDNSNFKFRQTKSKGGLVSYPAGTLILIGGFTRCEAVDLAVEDKTPNLEEIPAMIHAGTWDDALRLAWKENRHGRVRSPHEIELILESIHMDWNWDWKTRKPRDSRGELGLREAARLAGCSYETVRRWRERQAAAAAALDAATTNARILEQAAATVKATPLSIFEENAEAADEPETDADDPTAPTPPAAGATPTKATLSAGSLVRKDEWGRPIPVCALPLWEHVGPASKIVREIRTAAEAIVAMKHGPDGKDRCLAPALSRCEVRASQAAIFAAVDLIANTLPFIVCPSCDGRGCPRCFATGALNRVQADTLNGGEERKARSYQGAA